MSAILVAGIGNIFKGDDAFGVEVARQLTSRGAPEGVKVVDFGIRGLDLTYALLDGYDAAIMIDAVQRGGPPGEVYLIETDGSAPELESGEPLISGHSLDPATVLRLVDAMGGECRRIFLVGCEPLTFGDEYEGAMGLSEPVQAAVEPAVAMVEELVRQLREAEMTP